MKKLSLNNLTLNESNIISIQDKKNIFGGNFMFPVCCLYGSCEKNVECGHHFNPDF